MKCQSKINVNWLDTQVLIKGEWYECELTPTIYADTDSLFVSFEPHYVVRCEDGKLRTYKTVDFITLEDFRETKLNELGI